MTNTCKQRVKSNWASTRKDLAGFFKRGDYEGLSEYGLGIDLVKAGTFKDQRKDYIRYQFSWGGPADELRFYKNGDIEYWFLDWFDGACIDVTSDEVARQTRDYCLDIVPEGSKFRYEYANY